jgi:hypothetical protein
LIGRDDDSGTKILLDEIPIDCAPGADCMIVTDKNGRFYFDVPVPGNYTFSAIQRLYLAFKTNSKEVLIESGKTTWIDVWLIPGDIKADGEINILDLIAISRHYFTKNPAADINADGFVDIIDLVLAARNFGKKSSDTKYKIYPPGVVPPKEPKLAPSLPKEATLSIVGKKIIVSNAKDLYGIQLRIGFDSSSTSIKLKPSTLFPENKSFVAINQVNKEAKEAILAVTLLEPAKGISNGEIAVVSCADNINLKIKEAVLINRNYQQIPVVIKDSPKSTTLLQNYPNPFNPETWIPYEIPNKAHVIIKIYNLTGQLIRILDLGTKEPGSYTSKEDAAYWDGKTQDGNEAASGVYFYQLYANGKVLTKRMVVLK